MKRMFFYARQRSEKIPYRWLLFETAVVVVVAAVVIFLSVIRHEKSISAEIRTGIWLGLTEGAMNRANQIDRFSQEIFAEMRSRSESISRLNELQGETARHYLDNFSKIPALKDAAIVNAFGTSLNRKGEWHDVRAATYFVNAMSGRSSTEYQNANGASRTLFFSVPIVRNQVVWGVLVASYDMDNVGRELATPFLRGKGGFHITDETGRVVFSFNSMGSMKNGNVFDEVAASVEPAMRKEAAFALRRAWRSRDGGHLHVVRADGDELYLGVAPCLVTDWRVLTFTPPGYVSALEARYFSRMLWLVGGVLFPALVLIFYVVAVVRRATKTLQAEDRRYRKLIESINGSVVRRNPDTGQADEITGAWQARVGLCGDLCTLRTDGDGPAKSLWDANLNLSDVVAQSRESGMYAVQYKVQCGDNFFWLYEKGSRVMDVDGSRYLCGVAVDITELLWMRRTERFSLERLRVILGQTGLTLFEWDVAERIVRVFQGNPVRLDLPETFLVESFTEDADRAVCMDDVNVMHDLFDAMQGRGLCNEFDLRFRLTTGKYSWFHASTCMIPDESGQPVKGLCVLTDINDYKCREEHLRFIATHDSGTGLLNKRSTEDRIDDFLADSGGLRNGYPLFMLDMDHLKVVNDTLGHEAGDRAIEHIVQTLRGLFRESDILGRVGGDEFVVFATSPMSQEAALHKANAINERLHTGWFGEEQHMLSVSVGISFFPQDGRSFSELFHRADRAAYMAKLAGRDRCVVFEDSACGTVPPKEDELP